MGLAFCCQGIGFHHLGNQNPFFSGGRNGFGPLLELLLLVFLLVLFHHLFSFSLSRHLSGRSTAEVGTETSSSGIAIWVIPGWKGLTSWPKSVVSVHSRHEACIFFSVATRSDQGPRLGAAQQDDTTASDANAKPTLSIAPLPCDGPLRNFCFGHDIR